jgi:hypothetical protein
VIDFLNQKDPDWAQTQTVPPTDVQVVGVSQTSVELSWTPIAYTGDGGYYEVSYSTRSGGPYTVHGTTSDKTATGYLADGLFPGTTYYFVVCTYTPPHGDQQNALWSEYSDEVSATTEASTLTYVYLPIVLKNYKHNPYEPNDRFEEAYGPLYQGVSYFSYPDDQYDYYFFELLSSHSVLIEVRNYKAPSGDLLLYDEDRNLIGQWGMGGSEMRIEKEVLPPGRYYILVHTDPNLGFNMEDLYELKYTVGSI